MEEGRKVYIAKSVSLHTAISQAARTNASQLAINRSAVTLAKGRTFKVTGKITFVNPKKKPMNHVAQLRFYSSNKNIAVVSKEGVITAKAKGSCRIFVMTNNGVAKAVTVTVK